LKSALLDRVLAVRKQGGSVALLTRLSDGAQSLVGDESDEAEFPLDDDLRAVAGRVIQSDRGELVETPSGEVFVEAWNPPARLLVIGAVHIAQALSGIGAATGFRVTVIDPRAAFATVERFPMVEIRTDWPDEALAALAPDRRTAIVSLTHDPKIDDIALSVALRSPAFYIGALGSRKSHAARLERLNQAGFDPETLVRIHGPIGLAIKALTPAEIAVSILAEIIAARRGSPLAFRTPAIESTNLRDVTDFSAMVPNLEINQSGSGRSASGLLPGASDAGGAEEC
jgi:xanthine dehydrogenase accessory factor